jgi:hypothetical protein
MNSWSGVSMGKAELFLLILLSVSFALIDPPVSEVDQHNLQVAQGLNTLLHQNLLNCSEQTPSIDDPMSFYCVKALTLTPSVNHSITAKLHPWLIWAAAEEHNRTFRVNWSTECGEGWRTRTYGDAKIISASAYYTIDGLLKRDSGTQTFETANRTVDLVPFDLLSNTSSIQNPAEAPFGNDSISLQCSIESFLTNFLFGGLFNFDCYEETLDRASPYAVGVYNLTVRNQTIVEPHLNVTVTVKIQIPYREERKDWYKDQHGCHESDDLPIEDNATFTASDSDSYDVQNDYMTIIPYSPGYLNLNANASEDAVYHFSLLSNANLYKYYSRMDNRTAGAYYFYDFKVENDSLGIERIVAHESGNIGLLPDDPESANNYTGPYQFLFNTSGSQLRNPYETVNGSYSYNFSKVYDFMEEYRNLSNGDHNVELRFYTWFGNYTAHSNLSVRSSTVLMLGAVPYGNDSITVSCGLYSRGQPVAGEPVIITVAGSEGVAITDGDGLCQEVFTVKSRNGPISAEFGGSDKYWPSKQQATYTMPGTFSYGGNFLTDNLGLLMLLSVLFAFSVIDMMGFLSLSPVAGGATMGMVLDKFYPFKPRIGKAIATGINSYTSQVSAIAGKAVIEATAAVAAVVTGGAAAPEAAATVAGTEAAAGAAASAAAQEAVKKAAEEAVKEATKKALEDKMKKEMAEKVVGSEVNKKLRKDLEKKAKKKGEKKLGVGGGAGDDDKKPGKKRIGQGIIDNVFENPKTPRYIKEKIAPDYLNTPKARMIQRDILRPECIDSPRDSVLNEMAKVVEKKDGFEAKESFLNEHKQNKITFEVPSEKKWNVFEAVAKDPTETGSIAGVTLDGKHIRISPYVVDGEKIDAIMTGAHETLHTASKIGYENRAISDGFAENEAYRFVQNNKDMPDILKAKAELTDPYRDYCKISELTEGIVGREGYIYSHAKGGTEYLKEKFDSTAHQAGWSYDKIFGVDAQGNDILKDADKIDALRDVFETQNANKPKLLDQMDKRLDSIDKRGKLYDAK